MSPPGRFATDQLGPAIRGYEIQDSHKKSKIRRGIRHCFSHYRGEMGFNGDMLPFCRPQLIQGPPGRPYQTRGMRPFTRPLPPGGEGG